MVSTLLPPVIIHADIHNQCKYIREMFPHVVLTTQNTRKLVKLGTQQLDTFLSETRLSKGIGNMKETSENITNMAELWKSKNQLVQIMMGSSRMRTFNAASDRH